MKTLIALDDQEEQIDKFEEAADGINADMALAEKALKAMDMACWGLIPRFWVKDKGFKEDDAIWGDQKTVAGDPPADATETLINALRYAIIFQIFCLLFQQFDAATIE